MFLYANLHTHSTHSDGVYSPAELVRVAQREGYRAVVLTDHDTVTGYDEMKRECDDCGMETFFAAEFSVADRYHIVGINFDPAYAPMKEHLEGMSYRETDQTKILFDRGVKNGYLKGISWQDVLEFNKGITWLCNEHVFRAMKAMGLAVDTDYPAFFETVYGRHRGEIPAAYPFKRSEEMIRLIRDAGGIAVLAHPHSTYMKSWDDVDRLVNAGLDGIEVWHHEPTAEERRKALTAAIRHDLFVSGGSDHDGQCGGQYARYADPESCPFWIPSCSTGTTEFFFRELSSGHRRPERKEVMKSLLELL